MFIVLVLSSAYFIIMSEFTFSGYENKVTCDHLRNGETCKVTGIGNSMTPIL